MLLPLFSIPPGFLRRSLKASLLYGVTAAIFAIVYAGPVQGLHYLYFLGWMLANIIFWAASIREFFGPQRPLPLLFLITLKLFWLTILVISCQAIPLRENHNFLTFLLGINTPFLVMFLKVCGKAITRKFQID